MSLDCKKCNICLLCRAILEGRGLGWVAPTHKNNHGSSSSNSQKVGYLFENTTKGEIKAIAEKYRLDFELCGYEDTLDEMLSII